MFLGTPRRWWFVACVLFVAALALIGTDIGGTLGNVAGILLLFASMGVFAMSPMRYGQSARTPTTTSPSPPTTAATPRSRPTIEAGDSSDV